VPKMSQTQGVFGSRPIGCSDAEAMAGFERCDRLSNRQLAR
jgi:hypothetical protein